MYETKATTEVSWYEPHSATSLELIARYAASKTAPLIDVGGGASTLVDDLFSAGFDNLTVLDIADTALQAARVRLGPRSSEITWLVADVRKAALPAAHYAIWHDRAVFHFLTHELDRRAYVDLAKASLQPHGHIIIATFGPDGPTRCSGLEVVRYDAPTLQSTLGADFQLVHSSVAHHQTPWGAMQELTWCVFAKADSD